MKHALVLAGVALRNVTRQKRRSLAVVVALALATSTLLVVRGAINGVQTSMVRRIVQGQAGAVSVRLTGPTTSSLERLFDPAPVLAAVEGFAPAAPRLALPIVISAGDRSIVVWGMALDPERDPRVCPAAAEEIATGGPITATSAVTTPGIANALRVKLGDELVLVANDREGVLNAATLSLGGLTKGPPKQTAEDRLIYLPVAVATELARSDGQVGEVVLGSDDSEAAEGLAALVRAALPERFEVRSWKQMAPYVVDIISNQEKVLGFVSIIYALVAALGISHALVLSVIGRRKELGTMLALGLPRRSLLGLIVLETLLLSVVAAAIGALLGGSIVLAAHALGVPIVLPGGDTPDLVRPHLSAMDMFGLCGISVLVALLASFVPALRASRATPQGVLAGR